MDDAAFSGVVAVLTVVIAVQPLTGSIRRGGNSALSGAAFDLLHTEMIECDAQSPSSVSRLLSVA